MMPDQKPGRSRQDYGTPREFLEAVEARFGTLAWDLAASTANNVCGILRDRYRTFYGPGSSAGQDALEQDWTELSGTLWLNPEFGDLAPWAKKCADTIAMARADRKRAHRHDLRVCLLTPASVGAEWFHEHVHGRALVLGLSPRLTFVGETSPYPKDLSLSVFGADRVGFEPWRWMDRR